MATSWLNSSALGGWSSDTTCVPFMSVATEVSLVSQATYKRQLRRTGNDRPWYSRTSRSSWASTTSLVGWELMICKMAELEARQLTGIGPKSFCRDVLEG